MVQVNFKKLSGNSAPVRVMKDSDKQHASELSTALIPKLLELPLNEEERNTLEFIAKMNPELTCKFGGCSDEETAKKTYNKVATIGTKKVYSVETAPTNLFNFLANLSTSNALFRAVRIATQASEKAAQSLTFEQYCANNNVNDALLAIARDVLVANWLKQLRDLQVSEGAIRDLCKLSNIDYSK